MVLATAFFTGCNGTDTGSDTSRLARVGSEYLTLQEALDAIPPFVLKEDSLQAIRSFRDEWVRNRVLLQEAFRLQVQQNDEVRERLEKARQNVLVSALKDAVMNKYEEELSVTDEEARTYYQSYKDQFVLNERFVRFRHMKTGTHEEAQSAKRDLMRGIGWQEVARKYSVEPTTAIEASEQFWPISMAANEADIMNRYLRIIGQSEISPIQRVNNTYQFVQLMESRAQGEHPDLEWLMEKIKSWLILEKRRRHLSSYVKNLYLKAESNNEIETFDVVRTKPKQALRDTIETDTTTTN